MRIMGIDPGATTGWVVYDSDARRVLHSGHFPTWEMPDEVRSLIAECDRTVIERTIAHGPTRPQVVECAYVCGRLVGKLDSYCVHEMTRRDVKLALSEATQRDVVVTDDATAWAAILLLLGDPDAAKKGGALHGVRSHCRAALAVALAWLLRNVTP